MFVQRSEKKTNTNKNKKPHLWSCQLQPLNIDSNSVNESKIGREKSVHIEGVRTLAIMNLVYRAQIGLDKFGHTFLIESVS